MVEMYVANDAVDKPLVRIEIKSFTYEIEGESVSPLLPQLPTSSNSLKVVQSFLQSNEIFDYSIASFCIAVHYIGLVLFALHLGWATCAPSLIHSANYLFVSVSL